MTAVRKRNAFTPGQIETFLAIADTVVPSLTDDQVAQFKSLLSNDIAVNSEDEWGPILQFAKTSASETPDFLERVKSMEKNLNMAQFKAIAGLMDLLRYGWCFYVFLSTVNHRFIFSSKENGIIETNKPPIRIDLVPEA